MTLFILVYSPEKDIDEGEYTKMIFKKCTDCYEFFHISSPFLEPQDATCFLPTRQ